MTLPWPPEGTQPLLADVVSVQSQLVYGRVGNNVAVPTLTAMGLNVAAVPTVILSNTPHYPSLHGGALPADWFGGYLDDLVARGALAELRIVLTGYLGSPEQARRLAAWISRQIDARPELVVVMDPVIGDSDVGVYVDPGLVDIYRHELLPLASGLTPNHFELTELAGRCARTIDETIGAARKLLAGRTSWLAVTSAAPESWPRTSMSVLVVTARQSWLITHERVNAGPKGTGDLFTASLSGHLSNGCAPHEAALAACRHLVGALRTTAAAHCAELLFPAPTALPAGSAISMREIRETDPPAP